MYVYGLLHMANCCVNVMCMYVNYLLFDCMYVYSLLHILLLTVCACAQNLLYKV